MVGSGCIPVCVAQHRHGVRLRVIGEAVRFTGQNQRPFVYRYRYGHIVRLGILRTGRGDLNGIGARIGKVGKRAQCLRAARACYLIAEGIGSGAIHRASAYRCNGDRRLHKAVSRRVVGEGKVLRGQRSRVGALHHTDMAVHGGNDVVLRMGRIRNAVACKGHVMTVTHFALGIVRQHVSDGIARIQGILRKAAKLPVCRVNRPFLRRAACKQCVREGIVRIRGQGDRRRRNGQRRGDNLRLVVGVRQANVNRVG